MHRRPGYRCSAITLFVLTFFVATPVLAQPPTVTQPPIVIGQSPEEALDLAEPDFVIINLPTTLRLPVNKSNFHMTHRFNDNLRIGSFRDHLEGVFGLDSGANIGLEFRFGIMRHLQAIVQRTSLSRTIQFSAKYDAWHQSVTLPVSISGVVSVEGVSNFQRSYAPALGIVVSRSVADKLAMYATPFWVHNTGTGSLTTRDTGFLGFGARVRIGATTYLAGEVAPRIGGFVIGDPDYGFAIEKRAGAHVFSLTFTNGAATTYRQLANGGPPERLYLGFNLTRKFF